MVQFDPKPFVPQSNTAILNAIRNQGSTDYRSRVPEATKASIELTMDSIMSFKATRNEFLDALVNRIGLVIMRNNTWTNRLAKFKRGMLSYGETIEEIQVGLLKAHSYDGSREYLERDIWGTEKPDVQSSFHSINRQNFYKVTINDVLLRRAFLEEGGLSQFISALMDAPSTSDQWDEYTVMARLFREYYDREGFFKVNIPDVRDIASGSDQAKAALRAVRTMGDTLPFISTNYNAAHMPMAINPDDLELFVTPEFNAAIDVEALAATFNIDRAQIASRQTVIRQQDMNIPGAQAILTSKDFFVVADTLFETASIQNPAGLTQNYFLHHHQIVSASRFVPAVLFTTEPSTPIVLTDDPVTAISAITVKDRTGATVPTTALPRGDFYQVNTDVTPANTGAEVVLTLTGAQSDYTTLSQTGTLFVGVDEDATKLTITASVPDNDTVADQTKDYTLTGGVAQLWPGAQPQA
jgi:hypothetical protein